MFDKRLMQSLQSSPAALARASWLGSARPSQITPQGDWSHWLVLAGRGFGKTRMGAEDIAWYAATHPEERIAVVAPTRDDIRGTCFEGLSGLKSTIPSEMIHSYNRSTQEITLTNGALIRGFSADTPERLRGPQFHRAWCDEIAAWTYPETYDQLMLGLRLGDNPQCIITTTPKPTDIIRSLLKQPNTHVTRGSTFDNAKNLAPAALERLKAKYEGTRLGRQELYAEVLDDIEGALWAYSTIERLRVNKDVEPEFIRIVVAVDPAVTSGEDSDETGIVVAGRAADDQFYVLEDASMRGSPDAWMQRAVDVFHKWRADRIVAEVNNGGDLVERVLRTKDRTVPYSAVRASRGKIVRAEPIAALYEQGKVHHVGEFRELEDQLISYTPTSKKSPDRLDALVWCLTELSLRSGEPAWRIS